MSENLPQGWATASLSSLISRDGVMVDGDWVESKDQDPNGEVRLIQLADVGSGKFVDKSSRWLTSERAAKLNCTTLKTGDLLISRLGEPLGKACIFPLVQSECVTVVDVHIFRSGTPLVSHRWLMHALNSHSVRVKVESQSSGTTRKRITGQKLKDLQLPIPPSSEQQRIASRVDELFSSIDEGELALERVRKLVERYRQSVLRAAVTGELTRNWREQQANELESGESLLTRILEARRKAWETAEVAKMTAKKQRPLNDTWKKKYVAPPPPDIADLPELPPSWTWASLGSLIVVGPQNGVYIPQAKYGSGTPIIRIDDFQTDWIRPVGELRRVQATNQDCLTYGVKRADLIINRVNSISHLGKCMLVPEDFDGALFESNMMRCSVSDLVVKEVLVAYLNSEFGRRRATKNCKHAVNQASINQDDVAEIPIPLPPLAEQQALADAIRLEMSKLPDDFDGVSKLAAALRQSLLRDAFAGLIVPQNPTDEPASTLLERIAAQRADRESSRKRVPKPLRRKNAKA